MPLPELPEFGNGEDHHDSDADEAEIHIFETGICRHGSQAISKEDIGDDESGRSEVG